VVESGNRIAAMIGEHHPDAVFIDEGGVGGGVVDFVRHLGHQVIGVNFGSKPGGYTKSILVANRRAEMYVVLREWLRSGGCIEDSEDLQDELLSIEYHHNIRQEIQLMSKEDMRAVGKESPDDADALALTFAMPCGKASWRQPFRPKPNYDPFSQDKLIPGGKPFEPAMLETLI
jgi:phage terminase large subunit